VKCAGKIAYPSPQEAHRALRYMQRNSRAKSRAMNRPFHCEDCHYWHIGLPREVRFKFHKEAS
jgi:hypothetical protein